MGLLFIIVFIIGISSLIVYANLLRGKFRFTEELEKNCLLTRHPILFLSGRRTVFYFLNYWNWIPYCLSDHGYDVYVLNLPWRNSAERLVHLKEFLRIGEQKNLRFHVIADPSSTKELNWLADEAPETIVSCTVVSNARVRQTETHRLKKEDLRPKRLALEEVEMPGLSRPNRPLAWLWRFLVALHNMVVLPDKGLDPHLTGIPGTVNPKELRRAYINIAVSLAEKDLNSYRG